MEEFCRGTQCNITSMYAWRPRVPVLRDLEETASSPQKAESLSGGANRLTLSVRYMVFCRRHFDGYS